MPPPASGLPARLVLGPALRAQSDGRLVRLVREGYESAFDEIVRRYRRPLDRFAAGIVGGRSEDVTQDSFRKALEALRRGDDEVELRPWLYRIVRNTALNDLRDRPPAAAELVDHLIAGGRSAAAEAEERAEVAALTACLQALPENQRAALVMRELEGMSHEEISDSLGISQGAARQAIARARAAVRSGFGALVPLPLLRALAGGSDGAAEAVGAGGAAAGGTALGGGAAVVGGGIGAGALKVGLATVVVAGSLGAGVAIQHHSGDHRSNPPRAGASAPGGPSAGGVRATPSPVIADLDDHSSRAEHDLGDDHGGEGPDDHGRDHRGHGGSGRGDDGHGSGVSHGDASGGPGPSGRGADGGGSGSGRDGPSDGPDQGGPGPSGPGDSISSGHGGSGFGGSGRSGPGDSGSSGSSGSDSGGSGGSGSGSSGSTSGGHGSDDATESVVGTETAATSTSSGSESSSSGSSGGPAPTLDSTGIITDDSGSGSGSSGSS